MTTPAGRLHSSGAELGDGDSDASYVANSIVSLLAWDRGKQSSAAEATDGSVTPEPVTQARLPLRAERGCLIEPAARATNEK